MEKQRPKVIISDFDRTLAYLYRDERLLLELAKLICEYYSAFLDIDPILYTIDGYKAWHRLHCAAEEQYDRERALHINEKAEQLVTSFEFRVMEKTPFFENVVQTFRHLHRDGILLMVVSSNSREMICKALDRVGVLPCFLQIVGRPTPFDPGKIKPSPYPIEQALGMVEAEKQQIWYIGDDLVDIEAARACGIVPVGVASGKYSVDCLKEHGATYAIEGFWDIYTLLG